MKNIAAHGIAKRVLTPEQGKIVKDLNPVCKRWATDVMLSGLPLDRGLLTDYNYTESKLYRSWMNAALENMKKIKLERGVQLWLDMLGKDVTHRDVKNILLEAKKSDDKNVVKMVKMLESFEYDAKAFYDVATSSLAAGNKLEKAFSEALKLPSVSIEFREKFEDRLFLKQCLYHWQNKKANVKPLVVELALSQDFSGDKKIVDWQRRLINATLKNRGEYSVDVIVVILNKIGELLLTEKMCLSYENTLAINLDVPNNVIIISPQTLDFYQKISPLLAVDPIGILLKRLLSDALQRVTESSLIGRTKNIIALYTKE